MKVYSAIAGTVTASVSTREGTKPLDPRLDLANHSPTGFGWGYFGSGPSQLALAILADCLGDDERAVRLHIQFKDCLVGCLNRDSGWTLTEDEVLKVVKTLEQEPVS
jgi:hypothetical protein